MVDIDLVMMDREFDSDPVKETCEEYGVYYLNPTRIFERSDEADTIAWMYRNGKRFHVTEEETPNDDMPTRTQIFPQRSNSDDEDDDDSLSDVWNEMCGEWEFEDVDGEPSECMSFSRLLTDIQREEKVEERKEKAQDGNVDTSETVIFETNHPYVTTRNADDQQMNGKEFIHMIERLIRWYRRRWGIENGFKKQKHFMVRTTSTERDYRFFNFVFACVLYNVWRLVDLLVKLAIDGENRSLTAEVLGEGEREFERQVVPLVLGCVDRLARDPTASASHPDSISAVYDTWGAHCSSTTASQKQESNRQR